MQWLYLTIQEEVETNMKEDVALARAIELNHSRLLDVHVSSEHPEVTVFVDEIYNEFFNERIVDVAKRHIKLVLLDLYYNWSEDPDLYVAYNRSSNAYKANTRYNELFISKKTIDVVSTLEDGGLVEQALGYFARDTGKGKLTRMRATPLLVEKFEAARFNKFDLGYEEDRLAVILRDKEPEDNKAHDIEYDSNKETDRMEIILKSYNALLKKTFIDIPMLDNQTLRRGDTRNSSITVGPRNKFVRRVFSRNSFEKNGRFYGGWWQNCRKDYRKLIFLDDFPTNEVDFRGLHIVMLYAKEGVSYWRDIGGDPYDVDRPESIEEVGDFRAAVKNLMLVMLNAKDKKSAFSAFRKRYNIGAPEKRYKFQQLDDITDLLEAKHGLISKYFFKDVGIDLLFLDSKITEIILTHFTNNNVPVLAMHDSYLIPSSLEDDLIHVMEDAFHQVMGVPFNIKGSYEGLEEKSYRVDQLEMAVSNSFNPYYTTPQFEEDQRLYIENALPSRTERYVHELKEFRNWLDN